MDSAVFLGLTLVMTAPALKDPTPGIVGEWVVERQETGGGALPFPEPSHVHFVFTADGKWAWFVMGFAEAPKQTYTVGLNGRPQTIDFGVDPAAADGYPGLGVFEVNGDTLTLCHAVGRHPRPKGFTVSKDDPVSLFVMKRVK